MSHGFVRQNAPGGFQVVGHVIGVGSRRNRAADYRMGEREFKEELPPGAAACFDRPFGYIFSPDRVQEIAALTGAIYDDRDTAFRGNR